VIGVASLRYLFNDFALDTERRELRRGTDLVFVEPQVLDLLIHLVRNRDRVVSKDDLIASIWHGRIVSESVLYNRINAARSAIGDSGEQQRLIKTLPRKGVRFIAPVRQEDAAAAAVLEQRRPLRLPGKPSIAVLPFTNMSGDPEQDYFADGIADEIITALSRCSSLFVIARNSSFTYKGKHVDVREIGRELGVRYVLEGSVRRSGDRLRIMGQLVEAGSAAHIWADRFDGDISDVFALQDRITEDVVGAIQPRLQLAEIERLRHEPTPDFDAYDLLLRAQALEYEFTEQSIAQALVCLERALAIDPGYAPAMALAAFCYAERHVQGWWQSREADAAEGLRLAVRALELGSEDAGVLWMTAFAFRVLGGDPHRATELVNRSLQLNPNSAIALTTAGFGEVLSGNGERALQLLQRAERLSPRDPKAWYIDATKAWAHFVAGQFEQAAARARKAWAENPRFKPPLRILAASLVKLDRVDEAAGVVRQVLTLEPYLTLSKFRKGQRYFDERALTPFIDALRAAGFPE
jgi:TolB-like protein/Flp pilus assembly protein TadD